MSPQYPNPPIREAVCEFRYQEDGHWDSASPGLVYAALRPEFPRRLADDRPNQLVGAESPNLLPQPLQDIGLGLQIVPYSPVRFWREADESGYIAVAPYRLSVHHFKPYPSWEQFGEIIRKGAKAYQDILNPTRIQRIGLRYINDLNLGQVRVSPADFLEFYPFIGQHLPQNLSGFRCSVQIGFENERDSLNLQVTTAPLPLGENVQLILDLDYFLVQPDEVSLYQAAEWLETAHSNLESVFEGCLKDTARSLFQ